jgi:DNA-binding response OmpR family regulator
LSGWKNMSIRILLADDSPFWREQLRMILEGKSGWTVYQATNGAEAVQKARWIQPDAVILDACMPVLDGLSAAREFRRMSPEVPVLIVTVDKTNSLEVMAREAGVLAVFSKMDFLEACDLLRTFLTRAA